VRPFYNRAVASGPAPPSFVASATGFVSNPASLGANPSFTVGPVTIQAGDLLVVAVGTMGGVAEPTVSVDGGGAPVSTEDVTIQNAFGLRSCIFHITGAVAGNRTVTVTGPGAVGVSPAGMGAVLYVLRGAAAAPFDKSATSSGGGSSGPFSVGPTPALTIAGQFDIAALCLDASNDGTEVPTPWASPFVDRAHAGPSASPGDDCTLWCADSVSLTTAAVTATSGNIADAIDFAMTVATYKHA
jgi:hypothetical protein